MKEELRSQLNESRKAEQHWRAESHRWETEAKKATAIDNRPCIGCAARDKENARLKDTIQDLEDQLKQEQGRLRREQLEFETKLREELTREFEGKVKTKTVERRVEVFVPDEINDRAWRDAINRMSRVQPSLIKPFNELERIKDLSLSGDPEGDHHLAE